MVIITVKCFAQVGKKKVSQFPFINGSHDFIGCLNNNMQLTKQIFTAHLMEQLSIIMPCIIKRGIWALCQVEPTIHPIINVSLLSHCTLSSISAARFIYYQKVEKRASVKMPTQGRGWGPLSFISFQLFLLLLLCFERNLLKQQKKKHDFQSRLEQKNRRGTETLRQGPHQLP